MPVDDGYAIHYSEVSRGTPIYSSDEVEVGTVVQILDNYRERIFDGIVMETKEGNRRFVDAPEVARTAERAVRLTITAEQVRDLPPPEKGPSIFRPRAGGRISRLLGGWRRE
ncbi:MAG TPA: hypothetical protein VE780_16625 [Thermoleophilaceae bacterium]|nr:hypothetical protein [Thermoleophilaceae bacterium]